jgi:PAS domain S-box-containing protein
MIQSEDARAYLAAIVDSSHDAIVGKDLDGTIRSCNKAAEELFGHTAQELIGRSVTTLIPEERQQEEMEILSRLRRGERIKHFETVRITKAGERIEVSLSISPIRNARGEIIGAAKIVRDLTEHNQTKRALAAQQEWFRVTLSSIGDAVIACDVDARVTYMNSVAEALTGWSGGEAAGRPLAEVFQIVNEETRVPAENPTAEVFRRGLVQGLANHTMLLSRDGHEWPIMDSAAPIRRDDGTIIGVVLVFHDITEARRAERTLTRERQWLRTTLESIGDAVIATDEAGRIVFMNRVAEALTAWRASDAQGRECSEVFNIVNEITRQPVASPVARVLEEGLVVGLANHTILIAADGIERPIDDSGAPIRDPEGEISGVVLVFRDITERRKLEDERRAVASEREQLLESERAARAEAERASRIKDDFVATLSHELRTPLNAILGWAEVLSAHTDPATVKKAVEVIARNTRVQAQLVSDLLDISRIVSGKLDIDQTPVNLRQVIENAVETIQPTALAKRITIESVLDPESGLVLGDADRLQQVVWNLLSNAVQFTPDEGSIRLVLRRNDGRAEFVVSDTGIGIAPALLPRVFERFRQSEAPTTRRSRGLGIGLSIAKDLVELHGGTIEAESPGEGRGATFTLRLPTDGSPIEKRRDAGSNPSKPFDGDALHGIHILVVDDDPDTVQMLKRLLEERAATVSTASSALEALAALEKRPDILVSDIGLPDVDGYELIRRVRALETDLRLIPAIALTAFIRAEDRTKALRSGYQSHLAKPIEPSELIAAIASFAGLKRKKRPGAPFSES